MMNITDSEGNVEVKKIHFKPGSETKEALSNPLLEFIYKQKKFNEKKANKILYYYMNIDNKYDLNNYLQYKMITPFDFIRAFYYKFMLITGIADTYRNEQYIYKSDIIYDFERLILMVNLNSMNRERVRDNINLLIVYFAIRLINEWKDFKADLFS
jgi:hypothetical protein